MKQSLRQQLSNIMYDIVCDSDLMRVEGDNDTSTTADQHIDSILAAIVRELPIKDGNPPAYLLSNGEDVTRYEYRQGYNDAISEVTALLESKNG